MRQPMSYQEWRVFSGWRSPRELSLSKINYHDAKYLFHSSLPREGFGQQQEGFEQDRRETYPNAQVYPLLLKESVPSSFRKVLKQQLYMCMLLQKHTGN